MNTDQSEFTLDSLATFSLDSLRDLLYRVTRLAAASDSYKSEPFRWFVGIVSEEANRRLGVCDGELLEQSMPSYPMDGTWPTKELKQFIVVLQTLSYSQLDSSQAKFIDCALWYAISDICARCEILETRFLKGTQNVA